MSDLDKDKVIADFTKNFKKAEGKEPEIEAKGGWYSVNGGKNMRLAQLQEWSDELAGGKKAETDSSPAKTKTSTPKSESKKSKTKQKTTKKSSSKKKSAAKKGDFSVKAFWAEKTEQENPGSRPPR
ncbi:hypothetical protein OPS25_08465 [Alteromonas ponticola]|uniref:Uncharacterized protein n=1 Tax=Alteromonas aquimaris TaxID=2998417 RepID=A0ABT3P6Y3_9ALTE|nr:hypothetical protein [Alteromonas aquimaris]MCW8108527.1 hypothetical protein [Alteromonas aquimaris]